MPVASTKRRCVVCYASYTRGESFCSLDGGAVVAEDAAVETDELVGATLDGRYLITRFLGRGGMGKVYEADHVGLGKRVAIKLISDADANRDMRARFRQEARAASKISHEHVVQIFDVGTDSAGRDYIVMEYVDGRDLGDVLNSGPLSVARAVAIAQQILRGLHASHAAGVVHRDIKPANIRLTNDSDFVKIMDFGISKSVHREVAQTDTGTGRAIGTPQFMAPEQILDEPIDHRADIYAAGATLYAMLAGKPPFASTSFTQRIDGFTQPPPAIDTVRSGLPPSLVAAISRALERSPATRFASALEFADALRDGAVIADARVEAATKPMKYPGAATPGDAPKRRWWPLAVLLALFAIAGGVTAIVVAMREGPTSQPVAVATPDAAVAATPPDAVVIAAETASPPDAAAAVLPDAEVEKRRRTKPREKAKELEAGTVIAAVPKGPICRCRVMTPEHLFSYACARKRDVPRCECRLDTTRNLCPFVITVTDAGKRLPDGTTGGQMNCIDRSRPECDPLDTNVNRSCYVSHRDGGVQGAPCTGYTSGMVEGDAPKQGTTRCDLCDWTPTAPKFYGNTGDTCVGFELGSGEKMTGKLECPRAN